MTIAFFAVSGLDVLDQLDMLTPDHRAHIIDWIYRHQVAPAADDPVQCGGFQVINFVSQLSLRLISESIFLSLPSRARVLFKLRASST